MWREGCIIRNTSVRNWREDLLYVTLDSNERLSTKQLRHTVKYSYGMRYAYTDVCRTLFIHFVFIIHKANVVYTKSMNQM